jgi:hypothetical protein
MLITGEPEGLEACGGVLYQTATRMARSDNGDEAI